MPCHIAHLLDIERLSDKVELCAVQLNLLLQALERARLRRAWHADKPKPAKWIAAP